MVYIYNRMNSFLRISAKAACVLFFINGSTGINFAQQTIVDFSNAERSKEGEVKPQKLEMPPSGRAPISDGETDGKTNVEYDEATLLQQRRALEAKASALFGIDELARASEEILGLRELLNDYPAALHLRAWQKCLFDDRQAESYYAPCVKKLMGYYAAQSGSAQVDYTAEVSKVLDAKSLRELQFCLNYRGLELGDDLLWQAYLRKRTDFAKTLLSCREISISRLRMYILALDIEQTLCKHENAN
jgi:hypothetical protein